MVSANSVLDGKTTKLDMKKAIDNLKPVDFTVSKISFVALPDVGQVL